MCFRNKLTEIVKMKSPRSPFRRHYREPMKPKLSRKIVPSAKVNLNAYWSQFEELLTQTQVLAFDLTINYDLAHGPWYTALENEVNDNLINEIMELGNK